MVNPVMATTDPMDTARHNRLDLSSRWEYAGITEIPLAAPAPAPKVLVFLCSNLGQIKGRVERRKYNTPREIAPEVSNGTSVDTRSPYCDRPLTEKPLEVIMTENPTADTPQYEHQNSPDWSYLPQLIARATPPQRGLNNTSCKIRYAATEGEINALREGADCLAGSMALHLKTIGKMSLTR